MKTTRSLDQALDAPLESRPMVECFQKAKRIVIVVPDGTRNAHLADIVPQILQRFRTGRIESSKIEVLIATGLHHVHTEGELRFLLGRDIGRRVKVYQHAPGSGRTLRFGQTPSGIPIFIARRLAQADAILSIGVIEPHLYAGYSGGAKTIAIGCAGEETINRTHAPHFLDHPKVRLGVVDGNPFQRFLWDVLDRLPVRFMVNLLNDAQGNLAGIFGGSPRAVFRAGVALADRLYRIKFPRPADAVICKVGRHKDVNFYQASRAFNYVCGTQRPVVKRRGFVIVCAGLRDGMGRGIGEKRFGRELAHLGSPERYIQKIKRQGCRAGEHRAYLVAQAMVHARLVVVGEAAPQVLKGLPFLSFRSLEQAVAHVRGLRGAKATFRTLPSVLTTIATVSNSS